MGNQQPVNGTPDPQGRSYPSSSGGGGGGGGGGGSGQHHHPSYQYDQQQHPSQQIHHHHHQQQQQQQQHHHQQQQHHHHYQQPHPTVPPPYSSNHTNMQHNIHQQHQQQQPQLMQHHNQSTGSSNNYHQVQLQNQRSTSDTSMTNMDMNNDMMGGSGGGMQSSQQQPPIMNMEDWLDDDTVPTVFRWEHGGRNVYITGTFNEWSRQIPMHRSGNDFTYIHNLKRGKHAFKFIVDDEWRFAPDQPTVADIEGRINNFIDVTSFKPYRGDKDFEKEKAAAEYGVSDIVPTPDGNDPNNNGTTTNAQGTTSATTTTEGVSGIVGSTSTGATGVGTTGTTGTTTTTGSTTATVVENGPDKDGEIYSHNMPDVYDYTKEPPPLPPHLRHIILNKPPQLQDTAALPVPQHVALNHLYCTAIRDNMMVLGITQRYKTKFVTTVYYSPCSSK